MLGRRVQRHGVGAGVAGDGGDEEDDAALVGAEEGAQRDAGELQGRGDVDGEGGVRIRFGVGPEV